MMKNKTKNGLFEVCQALSGDIREKLVETKLIWYWILFIFISAVIIMSGALFDYTKSYQKGDIATKSLIYEGSSVTYTSEVAYEQAVKDIKSDDNTVYSLDETCYDTITGEIEKFSDKVNEAKNQPTTERQNATYNELFKDDASSADYIVSLQSLLSYEIEEVVSAVALYFEQNYAGGVKEEELESFINDLYNAIDGYQFSDNQKTAAKALVSTLTIEPNNLVDEAETEAVVQSRISAIEPTKVTIKSGEKIVDEGTEITAEQIEALQKTGMLSEGKSLSYYISVILFTISIYFLLFLFCRRSFPYYAYEKEGILLIGIVLCSFLLLSQIIMMVAGNTSGVFYSTLGYLIPLPALALIFSTLINHRIAFVLTSLAGILTGLIVINQPSFLLMAICLAYFTIYTVGHIRNRLQFFNFGLYFGIVGILLALLLGLFGEQSLKTIGCGCVIAFFAGFVNSFLALGTIPLIENKLKISTPMKLMELSSNSHPLLKRLMAEAPGTYYHSILVANLAEAAADAIGADGMLTRIGAYYHDIGKLERPEYFTENQHGENPHDKLTPAMSVLIIVSHVKDGLEMAREYGLPNEVIDLIEQHHGDDTIRYFYAKAMETNPDAKKESFSYPFPKPQSKEAAILMMADTVQAALQSVNPGSMGHGELNARIHQLIQDRLENGQFAECDLTFKDLHVIQDVFVKVYEGITHTRIKYPDMKKISDKAGLEELDFGLVKDLFDEN